MLLPLYYQRIKSLSSCIKQSGLLKLLEGRESHPPGPGVATRALRAVRQGGRAMFLVKRGLIRPGGARWNVGRVDLARHPLDPALASQVREGHCL